MAQTDASPFPTKGQPYRLPVIFYKSDRSVVAGWTGASCQICKDGATWQAGPVPIEIPGGPGGIGYVDLSGPQMDGNMVIVYCSITNDSGYKYYAVIYPCDTEEKNQRETRIDRMLAKLYHRWFNKSRASDTKVTIFKSNDEDVLAEASIYSDGIHTYRDKM